jgi:hypothetical protein
MTLNHTAARPQNQLPDAAKVERHARHVVDKLFAESDRLSVQIFPERDAKLPPDIHVDWRIGNEAGVTFFADQREAAIAWTVAILKSGWLFFRV